MELLYRLLGAVAGLNQRMSRIHIRFIPANWIVMIGAGIGVFGCIAAARESTVAGSTPRSASLTSILAHDDIAHEYVTTSGTLDPGHGIESGKTDYALLTDDKTHQGILIEAPDSEMKNVDPRPATITGVIHKMPTDLREVLLKGGSVVGSVPVDTEYYLDDGDKPADPILLYVAAFALTIVTGLFVGTWLTKYIVFQREAATFQPGSLTTQNAAPSGPVSDLRATGRFYLNEKSTRRFLHMPAAVGATQDGHLAFLANVDTSPTMFGFKTQNRVGVWAMVVTRGTVRVVEPGIHYFGWNGRPALRFQYVDGMSGKNGVGLLSFANTETRDIVARDLQDPTLKPPPPPR